MNHRLLKFASSVASIAVPLGLLTGCPPPDQEWHAETEVHTETQGTLVTIQSTRRPTVAAVSRSITGYTLSPEPGAEWPGTGVYFLPPGMSATFEISGGCPGDAAECSAPRDQGIKVLEKHAVDTFALHASAPSVDLNSRGIKSRHLNLVVSTNLIPMVECASAGTCISEFDIDAGDNGDGTWTVSVVWISDDHAAPPFTPHLVAFGQCQGEGECKPGADDHLTIVSAHVALY